MNPAQIQPHPTSMLAGIRVLDLTGVVFGPLATQVLADYGADVIKVEPPDGDVMRHAGSVQHPGMGPIFLNLNRGKRSVVIDLKTDAGRELLSQMIESSDVFVHNVRRKAIDRLGFSLETVTRKNPRILYCAATGFASNTSRADSAAIDEVIQAACGMAALNADVDEVPRLVESLIADKVAGMGLACAILAGLFQRERTGKGCAIDVPMYESLVSFMMLEHLQGCTYEPVKGGVGYHRLLNNGRRIYRAKDGFIAMTPYSDTHWIAFFLSVGRSDLASDPRITDPAIRNAHISELYDLIESVSPQKTMDEWANLAAELGFPAQIVKSLSDVALDPELTSSGTFLLRPQEGVGPVRALASPGLFNGNAARHPAGAPHLGEHTREVLREMNFSTAKIESLYSGGAVAGQERHS